MTGLPSGWELVSLAELGVEVRESVTPFAGQTYELWSVPAFAQGKPEIVDGETIASAKRAVSPGDVLICKINPRINRVWLVAEPLSVDAQIASPEYLILRTSERAVSAYLRWYLSSPTFRAWIELSVEGATGSHTRAKTGPILRQRIPVPPLAEQRRIVAAIEEQFSRLDASDEDLRQVMRRLAALERAVVDSAVDGQWPIVRIADVTADQSYGSSAKARRDPPGTPMLRMGNIQRGRIDLTDLKYLPPSHRDAERFLLADGDLLFNRTNSPELVGKSAVFRSGRTPTSFASYLIRVRLTDDCVPEWVAFVINSTVGRRYIASVRSQQVGQANVNGTKLAAMPIALPPLDEQRRIVAEIDQQLSLIDSLRTASEAAQRRSSALRRAILERAFRGELVPQDPADEPASVLLERIRAERDAAAKPKQRVA
jgi:type I restriction enzyme S subunit